MTTRQFAVHAVSPDPGHNAPLVPYSQNDPRWAQLPYAAGTTFAAAGCYVTCVSMLATCAGYTDTPPETAAKLRKASCFHQNMLSYPHRIPNAYPRLEWPKDAYWNRQADRITPATWHAIRAMITFDGPLILKVDYKPANYRFNMHFVLATATIADADLVLVDPLDGETTTLLGRYGYTRGWSARQAIFGYRGLRIRQFPRNPTTET